MTTANKTAVADGSNEIQRKAASDADAVQCGVNIVAIVGSFHRHLLALQQSGVRGEELFNHPVALSFTSKLNSLCRMTLDRELDALSAVHRIERGEAVEYEAIPL